MMKLSELKEAIQVVIDEHGDLPIAGGYFRGDPGVGGVYALDSRGCSVTSSYSEGPAVEAWLG